MSAGPNPQAPASSPTPAPEGVGSPPVVRRRRGRTGLYAMVGVIIVVVVLVAVGASTNWYGLQKSSKAATCSSGITLQGDGAQVATPLMGVWTTAFQGSTGNMVNYPGSGSGTGLTHFTSTSIDFAMTDDPLTPAERTAMPTPAADPTLRRGSPHHHLQPPRPLGPSQSVGRGAGQDLQLEHHDVE